MNQELFDNKDLNIKASDDNRDDNRGDNYDDRRKNEYKNKASVEVCNNGGEAHKVTSNEVEAKKLALRVLKYEDVCLVFEGDTITYTIKICNDSYVDLFDVEFEDNIPHGLRYEANSFKVNNHLKTPHLNGQKLSYRINKLDERSETTICFKVKVL